MTKRLTHTTASEIRSIFREYGISPKRSLGQNFLVDANLLDIVAGAAAPGPDDLILEIGAGTGALTEVIARRCGHVIAVEKDDVLFRIAEKSLAEAENVNVINSDIMGENDEIAPSVLQAIRETLEARPALHFKVAGDLPYSVSTAVLRSLIRLNPLPEIMAVTVQAEVGERIIASPGSKSYGFLTVLIQSSCRTQEIRRLPPWVFWPKPKIWSMLITIEPRPELIAALPPDEALKRAAGALFEYRRKTAANALMMGGISETREAAVGLLAKAGVEENRRADRLAIDEIILLARIIAEFPRDANHDR